MSKQLKISWLQPRFPYAGHLVNIGKVSIGAFWFHIEVYQDTTTACPKFRWVILACTPVLQVVVQRGESNQSFFNVEGLMREQLAEELEKVTVYTTGESTVGYGLGADAEAA